MKNKNEFTSLDILKQMLLSGRKFTKYDFLTETNMANIPTVCLAQRVLDLKEDGWNIKSEPVKGKGTLRAYWMDKEDIKDKIVEAIL